MITSMRLFEAYQDSPFTKRCARFLLDKAPYALDEGFKPLVFRGTATNEPWYIKEPDNANPRKSANTQNFCTLLMNAEWPKRGIPLRQVICSMSKKYAQNYRGYDGGYFIVLARADAMVGVCSTEDIWQLPTLPGDYVIEDLNGAIAGAYSQLVSGGDLYEGGIKDDTLADLMAAFDELDAVGKDGWAEALSGFDNVTATLLQPYVASGKKMVDWLNEDILDPDKAGIRAVRYGDLKPAPETESKPEVWLDDECLLVRVRDFNKLREITRSLHK